MDPKKAYYQEMYRAVRQIYSEREVTAQEAALDALGLPLIEFSCQSMCVQVRKPADTTHMLCPGKMVDRKRTKCGKLSMEDVTYAPHVTKYIQRTCKITLRPSYKFRAYRHARYRRRRCGYGQDLHV
jgi:hypothetical protein